jgi:hypothetical protein
MPVVDFLERVESWGERLRLSSESLENTETRKAFETRSAYYRNLERYYANEIYTRSDSYNAIIKSWVGLPRNIRPVAMIAKRAVDWWPGQVYGGAWTHDGLPSSTGRPNRLPYDGDTPDDVRIASQQFFTWSNAPKFLSRMVHLGAKLGELLCEVEVHESDEVGGDKVYPVIVHPRHVVRLSLTPRGDVQSYRLAIEKFDDNKKHSYLWGKEVTKDTVTTYYDDEPYAFDGVPAVRDHPYGFCPAVWLTHTNTGGLHGAPAIDGIIPTLDEFQGLLSSIDDYIHRFIRQGAVVESPNPNLLKSMLGETPTRPGIPTSDRSDPMQDRQSVGIIPAPMGTRVHHIMQNLGLADANSHIDRIKHELDEACPWIVLQERLLEMDQVTKPGAMPLVNRVQQLLDDVVAGYDLQMVKLAQMGMAVGGYLIESGEWGLGSELTKAQKKFNPFDLDSYSKGALDFGLLPRELIPQSFSDKATEAAMIESVQTPTGLRHIGYSDEDIYGKGEGLIPEVRPGILQERSQAAGVSTSVTSAITDAFTRGLIGEPGQVPEEVPVAVQA